MAARNAAHERAAELEHHKLVFDLLKGSKEKVELECLQALKAKREAQVASNQQRSEMEKQLWDAKAHVSELEREGRRLDVDNKKLRVAAEALERKRQKKRHWKSESERHAAEARSLGLQVPARCC